MENADSDIAFDLQVQEVLNASLVDGAAPSTYEAVLGPDFASLLQDDHLSEYEQFLFDHYKAQAEAKRLRDDLPRQIHDRAFASEILKVPDGEWVKTGDNFNRPYGEGSSASGGLGLEFRVYAKGLVEGTLGAFGVAICDENDVLIFEMSKGILGKEREAFEESVEMKALIEGLDIAVILGLKRLVIITDCSLLYRHITRKNPPMAANVAKLAEQIDVLLRNFSQTNASLETPANIKYALELARNAIALQLNCSGGSSSVDNTTESCSICLEDTYAYQMFQIPGCLHTYCASCMMKHVQFKLLQGALPKCPHENCKFDLKLDSCKKFLTPELFEIISQRVEEASIPVAEKVYCPYPRCSALLSRTELEGLIDKSNITARIVGARKCPRCGGDFCIHCKVPWHKGVSCFDFQWHNPQLCIEDAKLKHLATQNLWRQCPKCNHMISLATGCYHIYCRCGHEFCYTCGAEWKNKKATCGCPIWDERNIEYNN